MDAAATLLPTQIDPSSEPPLLLGTRTMPSRYFLAPLAGYTHLAFRCALRELGGLGLATTDLVHATHLLSGHGHSAELIATSPADTPLSVQIFSGKTDHLVAAARWLVDHGYAAIDLNMGCPMAKVNGQGGGARLLCDADNACRLVETVVASVRAPVSVKMRLGWDRHDLTAPYLASRFQDAGVVAVTIHGRTRAQGFHGTVDLEGIAATVAAAPRIPVIGNGDVRTVDEALAMRRITGCPAVAIGRGAMLDPWIFRKLGDFTAGRPIRQPSADEKVTFLHRHFSLMTEQHGERSCLLFRKFAAWYGAELGIPARLEDRLRQIPTIAAFAELAAEIRELAGTEVRPLATALVKVPNGPNERW
jgi:tRNA-dihydrouridine synthase B